MSLFYLKDSLIYQAARERYFCSMPNTTVRATEASARATIRNRHQSACFVKEPARCLEPQVSNQDAARRTPRSLQLLAQSWKPRTSVPVTTDQRWTPPSNSPGPLKDGAAGLHQRKCGEDIGGRVSRHAEPTLDPTAICAGFYEVS